MPRPADAGRYTRLANWQFRIVRQGFPARSRFSCRPRAKCQRRLQHPRRPHDRVRVPIIPSCARCWRSLAPDSLDDVICPARVCVNDAEIISRSRENVVDLVIDAGPCVAVPTTVVDLATEPPAITRRGGGDPQESGWPDWDVNAMNATRCTPKTPSARCCGSGGRDAGEPSHAAMGVSASVDQLREGNGWHGAPSLLLSSQRLLLC